MCRVTLAILFLLAMSTHAQTSASDKSPAPPPFRIVIHGGAGDFTNPPLPPEREKALRNTMAEALLRGQAVLEKNGSAVDAVVEAITVLEDSGILNAGKGATLTSEGTAESVAALMDGSTLKAGAVANLTHVRNPIRLARLVMDKSPHVLLLGKGAEAFARQQGVQLVSESYFASQAKLDALHRTQAREGNHAPALPVPTSDSHDTVGVVALDKAGHLAAGTSSGGITNQWVGRVGDSPIIGAGTYANDRTCAVSATGQGEYFIRTVAAHDISALMQYKGMSAQAATDAVLKKVGDLGGSGGFIVVDRDGNFAMPFNSKGMLRGYIGADGKPVISILPAETPAVAK
jgi:beta-aspartyl-peptidase (threonine type)